MKMLRPAILILFVGVVGAQESSFDKKALDAALKGHVEDWSGGLLTLRWPFDGADELEDFDTRGMTALSRRVEQGRLLIEEDEDSEGRFLRLDHLHFQPPFSLRVKLEPRFGNSGLTIGFIDTRAKGGQTWVLLNTPFGGLDKDRMFGIVRGLPGVGTLPVAGPRQRQVESGKPVDLEVTIQDGEMKVRFGGLQLLHDPFFAHGSFSVVLGASGPTMVLDDLRIHGRPVPASLRKLVLGEKAEDTEEARRLEEGRTVGVAMAMARLEEPLSRELRRSIRSLAPPVRRLFVRARKAEGARDFEDAALLLQEAAVLAPESAIVLWRAGWNLFFAGEWRLAEKALRAATEAEDELGVAWRDLGGLLSVLERYSEALVAFDRALDEDPENALAYALKGQLLQGQGELDKALALYEEARGIQPAVEAYGALIRGVTRLKTPPEWSQSWTETTTNYEVSTNVGESFAKQVARRLEVYRAFLEEVVPLPDGARKALSAVWIFDARGQYNVFAGTLMSRTAESTAGVYHPGIRTLLLFDDVDREATFDTLFHEAFHQYLDRMNRTPPIWFNEGMAELFGALVVDDGGVKALGIHHGRLREIRGTLREDPELVPNLEELVTMPKVEFYEDDRASLNYAVAWSLCHFFMTGSDQEGRRLFRSYARTIFKGGSGQEAYAASFGSEQGRKVESFRAAWLRHLRRLP